MPALLAGSSGNPLRTISMPGMMQRACVVSTPRPAATAASRAENSGAENATKKCMPRASSNSTATRSPVRSRPADQRYRRAGTKRELRRLHPNRRLGPLRDDAAWRVDRVAQIGNVDRADIEVAEQPFDPVAAEADLFARGAALETLDKPFASEPTRQTDDELTRRRIRPRKGEKLVVHGKYAPRILQHQQAALCR